MAHDRPKFGSLFAGIGGIDKGFEDASWETAYRVEIDESCRKVLARHWPDVPRWGDIRDVKGSELPRVDCVAAGVPCQDVSVAGKGAGLNGERTGLFYEFVRILGETRSRWFLFESVPGLLSSNERRDFWLVIHALCEVGYGLAWRVLDSRYFGVPQRRRRVYIVGHLGGPCPPEVLFERKGGNGTPETSKESGQSLAQTLSSRAGADRLSGEDNYVASTLQAEQLTKYSSQWPAGQFVTVLPMQGGIEPNRAGMEGKRRDGGPAEKIPIIPCSPPDADGMRTAPGFPGQLDACAFDWPPDAPRYRALGNAVTVNVARWIGARMLKAWAKERADG